jgi:tetratricopeptide (TPR) repeat protein
MPPAKQKPNEACACGSGAKHKKCCGLPSKVAAAAQAEEDAATAAAQRAGAAQAAAAAERHAAREAYADEIIRLIDEATDAKACGEYARALRRCTAALSVCADALCSRSEAMGVGAHYAPQLLSDAIDLQARLGRLDLAQDCHARALAVTAPPHTFWARAVCCLTHAAWRDTALAEDMFVTPPPGAARKLAPFLRGAHKVLGQVYERAHGARDADALAAYGRALQALHTEPRTGKRDLAHARLLHNIGDLHWAARAIDDALRCYSHALTILQDARSDADPAQRNGQLAALMGAMGAMRAAGASTNGAAVATSECAWAQLEASRYSGGGAAGGERCDEWRFSDSAAADVVRSALGSYSAPSRQRPWLLRAAAMP